MNKDYYYKVEIELDEDGIKRETPFSLEKIYNGIREMFFKDEVGIEEIIDGKTHIFIATDPNSNDATLGYPAFLIVNKACFKDYITKMIWYDNDHDEGIEYTENFLAKSKA